MTKPNDLLIQLALQAARMTNEEREAFLSMHRVDREAIERLLAETALAQDDQPCLMIDDWQIGAVLGEGGYGTVYLGRRWNGQVEQLGAVKVISLDGTDLEHAAQRAFLSREIEIIGRLSHPFIARFLDSGSTRGGLPYLVTEYVKGRTLLEFCDQEELTDSERINLFLNVCEAVSYIHNRGLIHRDLKPNNILVQADDKPRSGIVKIVDFGIAQTTDPSQAGYFEHFGNHRGTTAYASPEQRTPDALPDHRSDIYSLGVVLYELLAGHLPPQTNAVFATRPRRSRGTANTSLNGRIGKVVMRAISPLPSRRFESVASMSKALDRALSTRGRWKYRASMAVAAVLLATSLVILTNRPNADVLPTKTLDNADIEQPESDPATTADGRPEIGTGAATTQPAERAETIKPTASWEAVSQAISSGDLLALKTLLAKYDVRPARSRNGDTAMHLAARLGYSGFVRVLLSAGMSPNETRRTGEQPLMLACRNDHVLTAKELLANGGALNVCGADGYYPIHAAASRGSVDMLKALLVAGDQLERQTRVEEYRPLHIAALARKADAVNYLLDQGASTSATAVDGKTALILAVEEAIRFDDSAIVKVIRSLLKKGADPNLEARDGVSALEAARRTTNERLLQTLNERGQS